MLNKIQINNFRNYNLCRIYCDAKIVVLHGHNGTGKTNILEAISLLSYGKGLRNAQYECMINQNNNHNFWSIGVEFGPHKLISTYTKTDKSGRRIFKIDDVTVKRIDQFAKDYYVLWMTYETDRLFVQPPSTRRSFIDMLCYSIFDNHASLLDTYDKLARERYKILSRYFDNNIRNNVDVSNWLDIIEKKIVDCGIKIVTNRIEITNILQNMRIIYDGFPEFSNKMTGTLEEYIYSLTIYPYNLSNCGECDNLVFYYRNMLKESRERDFYRKSTSIGPNKSDWIVRHLQKNIDASLCSAGEQKILLIAVFLSFMKYKLQSDCRQMILIFDDVITHLDHDRKEKLFNIIKNIVFNHDRIQVWLSGVQRDVFQSFENIDNGIKFIDIASINK